jgi:acetyltransferase-like isoleucine patch superfamily enzyme
VRGLDGVADGVYRWYARQASIGPKSRRARRFGAFGTGSGILFPTVALYGEPYIRIGRDVIVGPYCTLSAGVMPGHVPDHDPVVAIGDAVLIGRGSGIVGHRSVTIGDGVFTGHYVYVTDANHGYEDVHETIGRQFAAPRPVAVGAGSWLGHGSVVLPGATVGEHVAVGAGSVVTGDLPSYSVAVGNPARVIKRYDTERAEWISVLREHADSARSEDQPAGDG